MKRKIDIDSVDFEKCLNNALKSYGFLFPETDEQITVFEETSGLRDLPLRLKDSSFIFENRRKNHNTIPFHFDNSEGERNWAIAAREGKDIPESLLAQMKKDKEEAKKNQNGDK